MGDACVLTAVGWAVCLGSGWVCFYVCGGAAGGGGGGAGADALDKFRVNVRRHKGKALAKGQFSVNGQLLVAADDAVANGSGVMTVTTRPMLRAQASTGAAITLIKPTALFYMPDPLKLPRGRGSVAPAFSVRFAETFA